MRPLYTLLVLLLTNHAWSQATWEQMTNAPAAGRYWAAATGNSTHGYAGAGRLQFSGTNNTVADMYAYDAAADSWSAIPDYPAGVREGMDGFTIGERIFFAFGSPFIQFTRTVYEYLPATNTWTQHPDVPGIGFAYSHGFVIGDTYYIGPENGTNNVYAFNGTTNTWSVVAPFPGEDRRAQCAFAANGKGYIGMGAGVFGGVYGDWWEYDPSADAWTAVADIFPLADQASATAVGNVGFVYNTGGSGGGGRQLFRYDAVADTWIQDAQLPTDRIANGSCFAIGDHGYLVFGQKTMSGGNISSNELWRFTPGTTGIADEQAWQGVQVFGDLAGSVQVNITDDQYGTFRLELMDMHGRSIASHSFNGAGRVVLGDALAAGIYLARLQQNGAVRTRKVMVGR